MLTEDSSSPGDSRAAQPLAQSENVEWYDVKWWLCSQCWENKTFLRPCNACCLRPFGPLGPIPGNSQINGARGALAKSAQAPTAAPSSLCKLPLNSALTSFWLTARLFTFSWHPKTANDTRNWQPTKGNSRNSSNSNTNKYTPSRWFYV